MVALGVAAVSAVACGLSKEPPAPTPKEQEGSEPNPGAPKVTKEMCGKPVDCATGNESEQQTDISIGGRGPGLHVVRTYNSAGAAEATEAGPWGFGWRGPYDARLELNAEDETATVDQENGSDMVFYTVSGKYKPGAWSEATLEKVGTDYVYTLPNQATLEFNSEGYLIKETERNGNSVTLAYNKSHQLETVTDGAKRTLTFAYNKTGQVEKVTDPMKRVVSYTYSEENLASVTIEGKVRWEFEYEPKTHLLKKVTDGRKDSTTLEYDGSHRVVKEVQAGHERKWTYGSTPGTETTLKEPNGSTTLEKFNEAGEATEVTRAKGTGVETTTKYEYNSKTYNLVKMTDPNGHVWEYGYDSEGNKTSETDPSKDKREWKYDKKHDLETETTPEGETTTYKLNSAGEPEAIKRPIGTETQETKYVYEKGQVTEATNPLGDVTKYGYNEAGNKTSETDPEKNERKWEYNKDSQVISETSARGFATEIERDERGLPTKITDPLKHTTEYAYDGNGNIETETDGNKHTTKYAYNEENLPTKVEEPKTSSETEYDSEGKMTAHKDGEGHKWEYKRNQLEQITEEINPSKHTTKKTYEKAGDLETLEDPEKNTTTYKYDESNRLKSISYSTKKPSEVTYEYNKDSKVTKMTDETGTTENTYDKLDRLTEYKNGAKKAVKYKYNLDNEPTAITYPNGKEVTRAYDKDTRLEKVTDWNKNETTFKYNPDSQLEKTVFPAATKDEDTNAYNNADQMSEIKMLEGKVELGKLVYTRDGDGQVEKTEQTGLTGAETSETKYDEDNRLTEAHKLTYAYDKANRPTTIEGATGYTYNEADELKESPTAAYAYNEDGQRKELTPTSKEPSTTYTYDQAGNLTAINRTAGVKEPEIKDSYTYDGTNLRQTQTIKGTTTNLTWDTTEPIPIILEDETNNYIYGPENLPIEQIATATGEETYYLHHDQQGSTRLLTNNKGEKETAYTYNPYGTILATTSVHGATTPLRYDAQYTSVDTGLIYLRARTYDATTAQFLTVDPALEATRAPYTYTKDNPENSGDPTGMGCKARSFWGCVNDRLASAGIAGWVLLFVGSACATVGAGIGSPTGPGLAATAALGVAACYAAITGISAGVILKVIYKCYEDPNNFGKSPEN